MVITPRTMLGTMLVGWRASGCAPGSRGRTLTLALPLPLPPKGTSVLMTDIDVVYLQNPFLFLHKVT